MNPAARRPAPAVPRVRLVDVAREAGLSKTTVSAALNGTGRLSGAVRAHAQETARRLGYRPNATARLLRVGHTRLIGFAVREYTATPWAYTESPYLSQLTAATAQAALERGYALVLLPNHSGRDEWADLPLDAVIVVDPAAGDPLTDDFLAAGIPVFSDRRTGGRPGAHWVDIDHEPAVRGVLDHLHTQGARDIAVLAADTSTHFTEQCLAAHARWCAEHGTTPRVAVVDTPGNAPALAVTERLLAGPGRPDALFTLTEVSPPLLVAAIGRLGLHVPRDLLLVCTSEDGTAAHTAPPVTTFSLQPAAIGAAGIRQLIDALETGTSSPGVIVPTRLDVRASSQRARG